MPTRTDIVLVNTPMTQRSRYGTRWASGERVPPVGLAYLGAAVREAGFRAAVLDPVVWGWDVPAVVEQIRRRGAEVVGLSAVTASVGVAAEIARRLKAEDPSPTVILGGAHVSAVPEETLRRYPGCFDWGVLGEGEVTLVEILQRRRAGTVLPGPIPGTICRDGDGFRVGPRRERVRDLDSLPPPAWELLDGFPERYDISAVHSSGTGKGVLLITSRGCPMRCSFCSRSVFGNTTAAHSAGYVCRMVEELVVRYGIREVQFEDDNFTYFRERLVELCRLLLEKKLRVSWSCLGQPSLADPGLLRLMRRAGCWHIKYGIESADAEILRRERKPLDFRQLAETVRLTAAAGITPTGLFILGHPGETAGSVERTIELALTLPLAGFFMTFMTPYPGTELHRTADEFGTMEEDWDKMTSWLPVFVPRGLSVGRMMELRRRAYLRFYLRPRIVWRFVRQLRTWRQAALTARGLCFLLGMAWAGGGGDRGGAG